MPSSHPIGPVSSSCAMSANWHTLLRCLRTAAATDTARIVAADVNAERAQFLDNAAVSLTKGGNFAINADSGGIGNATSQVGKIGPDDTATGAYQAALTQRHMLPNADGKPGM